MAEEVRLTPQEAQWLALHLMEVVQAIEEGVPLRGTWSEDTGVFLVVLIHRIYPDGPPGRGWGDPSLN